MPDGWSDRPIIDCLAEEFAGEWGSAPARGGNATVLRSTDIDDDGHVDVDGGARRTIPLNKLGRKALRPGDVLLEGSGGGPGKPVGRVALFRGGDHDAYLCSNFFRTLRPASGVQPGFLAWKLQHFYRQPQIWVYQQQTTGIINLRFRDYAAAPVGVPPLPEQQRIAEILDTVDEAIRKTEEIIAKLKQVKQGLLHDLLTRGIDDNGELRDPDRHPEQFKDCPLGPIPKAWEVKSLVDCGDLVTGTTPPSRDPASWGDVLPFVTPAEVDEEGRVAQTERWVSEHGLRYVRSLPAGCVLVVCIGSTLGKVGLAPSPCATNQQINALVPAQDVDPSFAAGVIRKHIRQLHRWAGLQAVPIVNKSQFGRMLVPLAPSGEQREVAARLEAIDLRLRQEQRITAKLAAQKQGLMEDLLTGRVRVTSLLREAE